MRASLKDSIIGYGYKSLMSEGVTIKICRIVMVSTNEHYPVVCFVHAFGISFHHILVTFLLFKAKSTIACHNQHGISHLVLYTEFEHQLIEVTMNIARNHYALASGKERVKILLSFIFMFQIFPVRL